MLDFACWILQIWIFAAVTGKAIERSLCHLAAKSRISWYYGGLGRAPCHPGSRWWADFCHGTVVRKVAWSLMDDLGRIFSRWVSNNKKDLAFLMKNHGWFGTLTSFWFACFDEILESRSVQAPVSWRLGFLRDGIFDTSRIGISR